MGHNKLLVHDAIIIVYAVFFYWCVDTNRVYLVIYADDIKKDEEERRKRHAEISV